MELEPQRWTATYTTQLKKKRKAYHDGVLLLYPDTGRLVLLDDAGATIDSRFLQAGKAVSDCATLEFPRHLVDVGMPQRQSACYSGASSATAASRTAYRGLGLARPRKSAANASAPRAFVKPLNSCRGEAETSSPGDAEAAGSRFQEWSAMYTTQVTQKAKKYHDGFLRLVQVSSLARQIILLDEDGEVLGSRYLKSEECVENGKKCNLPNYLIEVGEAKNQNKGVQSNSSEEPKVQTRLKSGENASNTTGIGATSSLKLISPQEIHEWTILYTTQLTQKSKKYHDGVIRLMQVVSHARQIVLLDEDGGVLGSRYLKSGESIEAGMKCQFPNYLIEVVEIRNQRKDIESKLSSGEALNHTGWKNGDNTIAKTGGRSKSPKFISPHKFHAIRSQANHQKSKSESTTSSNRPQDGKSICSNVGDPLNFHAFGDLQRGKPDCSVKNITDLGRSTFSNVDDPHKFNDFADIQRGKPDCTVSSRRTDLGKSTFINMGDPHKFNDFRDTQRGKPDCTVSYKRTDLGISTFSNTDDLYKFKEFADIPSGKPDCTVSYRKTDLVKSKFSNMDDPHKFNDLADIQRGKSESVTSYQPYVVESNSDRSDPPEFSDLQDGKSVCSNSLIRGEVGKSTLGNMDDPVRTASQILSIMKPPARLSHFATQLRTSVQSCLMLNAVQTKNSETTHHQNESSRNAYLTCEHQTIMKPAALDGLDLAMVDMAASEMPNANDHKLDSLSSHRTGKSNDCAPIMNLTKIPGLQEDKRSNADQLDASNIAVDPKSGSGHFLAPSIWTCKDPNIQDLMDDCPSFDLGF